VAGTESVRVRGGREGETVVKAAGDFAEGAVCVTVTLARIALAELAPVKLRSQHEGVGAAVLLPHGPRAAIAVPMHLRCARSICIRIHTHAHACELNATV
jgi:hypothetical protein